MTHTPTPYKWEQREANNGYEMLKLLAAPGFGSVLCPNYDLDKPGEVWIDGYPRDFEFIERACNSFDDLLEACQYALQDCDGTRELSYYAQGKIRAAVAKAVERPG